MRTTLLLLATLTACADPVIPAPLYPGGWTQRIAERIVRDGFDNDRVETAIGTLMANGIAADRIESSIPLLEAASLAEDRRRQEPVASADYRFAMPPPASVALEAAFPWCAFGVSSTDCW